MLKVSLRMFRLTYFSIFGKMLPDLSQIWLKIDKDGLNRHKMHEKRPIFWPFLWFQLIRERSILRCSHLWEWEVLDGIYRRISKFPTNISKQFDITFQHFSDVCASVRVVMVVMLMSSVDLVIRDVV